MSAPQRAPRAHLRVVPDPTPAPERRSLPTPALDDAQLIAALRVGDPSAAASLHDRARPVVERAIFRVLGRRDRDHDDMVQNALIEVIGSIDRFRGECPLDGWIATVAAHTVYKHLRRRRTESRIFEGSADDIERRAGASYDPERRTALRNGIERLRGHLDALEGNKAWTFLLHDVCGYDLKEIATITEVSVAAAQGRLSRGRRELMARIAGDAELASMMSGLEGEVSS